MYKIIIPEGVTAEIHGTEIEIKGSLGSNRRKFNDAMVKIKKDQNTIIITPLGEEHKQKREDNVARALSKEIGNDIAGVGKHFEVEMETVFAHFPITVESKESEHAVHIKNIFGERIPRTARIVGSTKVEIKDKHVRIYGTSLDDVTQTAANIRLASKAHRKDERVFQDGVYYSQKE